MVPQGSGNSALEDEVVVAFRCLTTELACVAVHNMFLVEVDLAPDAFFQQQPSKEFDTRGCAALPNKAVNLAVVAIVGGGAV